MKSEPRVSQTTPTDSSDQDRCSRASSCDPLSDTRSSEIPGGPDRETRYRSLAVRHCLQFLRDSFSSVGAPCRLFSEEHERAENTAGFFFTIFQFKSFTQEEFQMITGGFCDSENDRSAYQQHRNQENAWCVAAQRRRRASSSEWCGIKYFSRSSWCLFQ